jgi:UDP-N-acetylmuramate-alanine ligase
LAWLPEREGLRRWLLSTLRPGDLCLTLGAGDLTTLPDELLQALG